MNALSYNSALPENRSFKVVVQARSGLILYNIAGRNHHNKI